MAIVEVESDDVRYTADAIEADYEYKTSDVSIGEDGKYKVSQAHHVTDFKCVRRVPL